MGDIIQGRALFKEIRYLIFPNLWFNIEYNFLFQKTKISHAMMIENFNIHCKMNLRWFPFDIQNCFFVIFTGN